MVTSNKPPEKKVVKMSEPNNSAIVHQRTLLGEVNEHITCPLCRGYYIDATTIVECLHSFCRSCIIKHLQVKSYCPVCEMMINSAKPNIKLDKALQDIVYKLVPGLFQREMERRQHFYSSRPGPAASATPEQRGEDTERIIFSPEDVISFSLEYADATDTDSISSKSSDSNEPQPIPGTMRRYLQCPAVVNVSHLKKFLCMKFDIDSTLFAIDILYKRVPLPDYYTLMDIAYIYNWKRNEPMRFFYQIIDFVAIRNRIFDVNRKGPDFHDRKSSPTPTEDTNVSSPNVNTNDNGSDASSGTESPSVLDENKTLNTKKCTNIKNRNEIDKISTSLVKKPDEDVEKSQFLNSFELTAKNNSPSAKSSPSKSNPNEITTANKEPSTKNLPKVETDESLKRKHQSQSNAVGLKKLKIEIEKAKIPIPSSSLIVGTPSISSQPGKSSDLCKTKDVDTIHKNNNKSPNQNTSLQGNKDLKQTPPSVKLQDTSGLKRNILIPPVILSPKRKSNEVTQTVQPLSGQKTVSPLKVQLPKAEQQQSLTPKSSTVQKAPIKRMPDLKPSNPLSSVHHKGPTVNKVRMDLLANNSDPTIDRTKILSQVKSSLSAQSSNQTASGDPLKSLFNACNINIPSSLSITLTDQKEGHNAIDNTSSDTKPIPLNKNMTAVGSGASHKIPSTPVHNYIEIRKLPESDPKKQQKSEPHSDVKGSVSSKSDSAPTSTPQIKSNKSSETTGAKGPVPNLKPIADAKLAKQAGSSGISPITFQQQFEQQLQTLQTDKKPKLPKNKAQVPKLVPATPKAFSAASKLNPLIKSVATTPSTIPESKTSAALDLSTPHNSPSTPQHSKAFETMQSIANLAKKQNVTPKGFSVNISQNRTFPNSANRSPTTPLRIPIGNNLKQDKGNSSSVQMSSSRSEILNKSNQLKHSNNSTPAASSPNFQIVSQISPLIAQPSPRQTRSPSSSPKLVIAEDKQANNSVEQSVNQSNQISSTQLFGIGLQKSETPKPLPGPSKSLPKPVRPSAGKIAGIQQQPLANAMNSNLASSDYLSTQMLNTHQAIQACVRQQMEISNAWFKAQGFDLYKNMSNIGQQKNQNDFKEKQ